MGKPATKPAAKSCLRVRMDAHVDIAHINEIVFTKRDCMKVDTALAEELVRVYPYLTTCECGATDGN